MEVIGRTVAPLNTEVIRAWGCCAVSSVYMIVVKTRSVSSERELFMSASDVGCRGCEVAEEVDGVKGVRIGFGDENLLQTLAKIGMELSAWPLLSGQHTRMLQ